MCRNIKTLYNFEPPATEEEIRAAALQYVRKISGFTNPSAANQEAFDRAVDEVAQRVGDAPRRRWSRRPRRRTARSRPPGRTPAPSAGSAR